MLLKETWSRPFQYEPCVGFKERPRNGKFVNISKEGFRYSHIKDLTLKNHGINIYVFGGSTTFGYGAEDASTIPAHLQRHLSNFYPDKNIHVFNFGRGSYFSTQELTLLLQLLRNGRVPNIAIFIDGLNETKFDPHYTNEMSKMFDRYNYSVLMIYEMLPLVRARNSIAKRVNNAVDPLALYDQYVHNKKIITYLGSKYAFATYFFIQPVPGWHNNFLHHKFVSEKYISEYEFTQKRNENGHTIVTQCLANFIMKMENSGLAQ